MFELCEFPRKIFNAVVDDDKLDTTHLSLILTLASCPVRVKIVEEKRFARSVFHLYGRVNKSIGQEFKDLTCPLLLARLREV
jgi:hypothetical protein